VRGGATPAKQADWLSVVVIILGVLAFVLIAWARVEAIVKPVSESLEERLKLLQFPDHSAKSGYHQEVRGGGLCNAQKCWLAILVSVSLYVMHAVVTNAR
jgi:hypothetical protein